MRPEYTDYRDHLTHWPPPVDGQNEKLPVAAIDFYKAIYGAFYKLQKAKKAYEEDWNRIGRGVMPSRIILIRTLQAKSYIRDKGLGPLPEDSREEKVKAQLEHCKENGYPHFAPYDGICYKCGRDIYKNKTLEQCESLITGCPHCHWSYCE